MTPEQKNRIAHEKIMGLCWHEPELKGGSDNHYNNWVSHNCKHCGEHCSIPILRPVNPDYYHSIADALELVEKMIEGGWWFERRQGPNDYNYAEFSKIEEEDNTILESSYVFGAELTPAAAITDAALKAIGED